ncbi:MAG: hypothetical protein H0X30_02285 [Anaerolineae bacterium]|nr:hypothetical protein [Anaerolineae bacterium]
MRFFKLFAGYLIELWPLALAVLLLDAAKSLEWAFIFPALGQFINYRFLSDSRLWIPSLALCILPLSVIAIFYFIGRSFDRKIRSRTKSILNGLALLCAMGLLIYANGLMCLQTFALALSDFDHFQSIKLDDHTYYIDSIWKEGIGRDHKALFTFFECDSDGTWCESKFEKWYFPKDDEYPKMSTKLLPNPTAHTVTLQINGETVYVHPVK